MRFFAVMLAATMAFPVMGVEAVGQEGPNGETCDPEDFDTAAPFTDRCYHQGVWYSPDTAEYDVVIVPPVSPYFLRDVELVEESVDMWEEGIKRMSAAWLDLNINDYTLGLEEVPPDALQDPEVIVLLTTEFHAVAVGGLFGVAVQNPLGVCGDVLSAWQEGTWQDLDGFHQHPGSPVGSYVTNSNDCPGTVGFQRQCIVVNTNFPFAPVIVNDNDRRRAMFDLISHEVGHCLTLGHVGDAADVGDTTDNSIAYPEHDILSYEDDGLVERDASGTPITHCPSSLNVLTVERAFAHLFGREGATRTVAPHAAAYTHMHPDEWHTDPGCDRADADWADPSYLLDRGLMQADEDEDIDRIEDNTITITSHADGATVTESTQTFAGTVSGTAGGGGDPTDAPGQHVATDAPGDAQPGCDGDGTPCVNDPNGAHDIVRLGAADDAGRLSFYVTLDDLQVDSFEDFDVNVEFQDAAAPNVFYSLNADVNDSPDGAQTAGGALFVTASVPGVVSGGPGHPGADVQHRVVDDLIEVSVDRASVGSPVDGQSLQNVRAYTSTPDSLNFHTLDETTPAAYEVGSGEPAAAAELAIQQGPSGEAGQRVELWVDGALAGSQPVDPDGGTEGWSIEATLAEGDNTVSAEWYDGSNDLVAEAEITVYLAGSGGSGDAFVTIDAPEPDSTVSGPSVQVAGSAGHRPEGTDIEPPSQVTGLTVDDAGRGGALDLAWDAATDDVGVDHYNVLRADASGGDFVEVGASATASFQDTGLDEGTAYFYKVNAEDAAGNVGPESDEASGTPTGSVSETYWLHHLGGCADGATPGAFMDRTDSEGDDDGCGGAGTGPLLGAFPAPVGGFPIETWTSTVPTAAAFDAGTSVSGSLYLTYWHPSRPEVRVELYADDMLVGVSDTMVAVQTSVVGATTYTEWAFDFETTQGIAPGATLRFEAYHFGTATYFVGYEDPHASTFTIGDQTGGGGGTAHLVDDAEGDAALGPYTDILFVDADNGEDATDVTLGVAELMDGASGGASSLGVFSIFLTDDAGEHRFESYQWLGGVDTYDYDDPGEAGECQGCSTTFDTAANEIRVTIPHADNLAGAPTHVRAEARVGEAGLLGGHIIDDTAPDSGAQALASVGVQLPAREVAAAYELCGTCGADKVTLFVDETHPDNKVGEADGPTGTNGPDGGSGAWSIPWDSTRASDGQHALIAVYTDSEGRQAEARQTVRVDNRGETGPQVTITDPADGSQVDASGDLQVSGEFDPEAVGGAQASASVPIGWKDPSEGGSGDYVSIDEAPAAGTFVSGSESFSGRAGTSGTDPDGCEPDCEEPIEFGEPQAGHLRPGDWSNSAGSVCTLNFLYEHGGRYFFGSAAHCVGTGGNTNTNGCTTASRPIGSPVSLRGNGITVPATLAYSSWETMQRKGETNDNACFGNDFALLEVSEQHYDMIHPAVRMYGGPTALGTMASMSPLDDLRGYGRSSLHDDTILLDPEASVLNPKNGYHLGQSNGGWSYWVYLLPQGVPGDSGGGIMDIQGNALGAASTISAVGASNNYANIARALEYMQLKEGWAPELVTWEAFDPNPRLQGTPLASKSAVDGPVKAGTGLAPSEAVRPLAPESTLAATRGAPGSRAATASDAPVVLGAAGEVGTPVFSNDDTHLTVRLPMDGEFDGAIPSSSGTPISYEVRFTTDHNGIAQDHRLTFEWSLYGWRDVLAGTVDPSLVLADRFGLFVETAPDAVGSFICPIEADLSGSSFDAATFEAVWVVPLAAFTQDNKPAGNNCGQFTNGGELLGAGDTLTAITANAVLTTANVNWGNALGLFGSSGADDYTLGGEEIRDPEVTFTVNGVAAGAAAVTDGAWSHDIDFGGFMPDEDGDFVVVATFLTATETIVYAGQAPGPCSDLADKVKVTFGGKEACTPYDPSTAGSWSTTVEDYGPLQEGAHEVTATAHDGAGNVVATHTVTVQVVVDADGDGVPDGQDNCPEDANPDQSDVDGDGIGDACDPRDNRDSDGDGVENWEDACPGHDDNADLDGDGVPDGCDGDRDGDGVPNEDDAFPDDGSEWADADGDGVGDNSDACPGHDDGLDTDGDGTPNHCDDDVDGDGRPNDRDADSDGDGHPDGQETARGSDPYDPGSTP